MTLVRQLSVFLSFLMIFNMFPPIASGQRQVTPQSTFSFDRDLPDPNYYSRDFVLVGLKPTKDLRYLPADLIIRNSPQGRYGFLTSWLQPNQKIAVLTEVTEIVMVGSTGDVSLVNLRPDEAVMYDAITNDILAVIRCANKVLQGKIILPEPEIITNVVTETKYEDRPVYMQPASTTTTTNSNNTVTKTEINNNTNIFIERKGGSKKTPLFVAIVAVAVAAIAYGFLRGKNKNTTPEPYKPPGGGGSVN